MVEKYVVLGFLWILFCGLHSLLAALSVKKWMAERFGSAYKYYRLAYTLFAFITLAIVVYYGVSMESSFLYNRNAITNLLGFIISIIGLVVMAICIKKYFISLSGLKSLYQESPTNALMVGGIHQFVRHPLYTGTFMAIWGVFIAYPFISLLISNLIITIYTLIGIELEEKKLEGEFGKEYAHYKQMVPKLFPGLRLKLDKDLSTPKN